MSYWMRFWPNPLNFVFPILVIQQVMWIGWHDGIVIMLQAMPIGKRRPRLPLVVFNIFSYIILSYAKILSNIKYQFLTISPHSLAYHICTISKFDPVSPGCKYTHFEYPILLSSVSCIPALMVNLYQLWRSGIFIKFENENIL